MIVIERFHCSCFQTQDIEIIYLIPELVSLAYGSIEIEACAAMTIFISYVLTDTGKPLLWQAANWLEWASLLQGAIKEVGIDLLNGRRKIPVDPIICTGEIQRIIR